MRSRCSHLIQPTNAAMINGSGNTHGVYAKAASVELSDITGLGLLGSIEDFKLLRTKISEVKQCPSCGWIMRLILTTVHHGPTRRICRS